MPRDGESGVTPVIGTILVLAITVSGIAVTLFLGAPVLQRLQEQAALETMVGQFQDVRHAVNSMTVPGTTRTPGLTLPGGAASLVGGPSLLVAFPEPGSDGCVVDLIAWSDTDNVVDATTNGCGLPGGLSATACSLPFLLGFKDCIEVFRDPNGDGIFDEQVDVSAAARVNGFRLTLGSAMNSTQDYRFQLVRYQGLGLSTPPTGQTLATAFILRSDALQWDQGSVAAQYAWGAILGSTQGSVYLTDALRMSEGTGDGPLFLALPSWQALSGSVSGSGSHSVAINLDRSVVRVNAMTDLVLLEFGGGQFAKELCTSVVLRNSFQDLSNNAYVAQPSEGNGCGRSIAIPGGVAEDDDYSVLFNPAGPADFSFLFTQVKFDARLVL